MATFHPSAELCCDLDVHFAASLALGYLVHMWTRREEKLGGSARTIQPYFLAKSLEKCDRKCFFVSFLSVGWGVSNFVNFDFSKQKK